MKTRILILPVLIIVVLIITGSCATGKKAVKAPIESLYGTWVNSDYNTRSLEAKLIFKPDGTYTTYSHIDLTTHSRPNKYTIQDSWIDSDGKKYYKVDTTDVYEGYSLYRLDETDSVLEIVWSQIEYPSEIDTNHLNYKIYYRQ
jgi:hypothetical protein